MKGFIKKISPALPRFLRIFFYKVYEDFFAFKTIVQNLGLFRFVFFKNTDANQKKRILFYHISGLSFGGTEKFLQIIAKYIDKKKYEVFFLYSSKARNGNGKSDGRMEYMKQSGTTLIDFDYESVAEKYPYKVNAARPSFFEILEKEKIDLIFTTGSGYSEYPFNITRKMPIVLINIFGSPSAQKNIEKHICISHEVAEKIEPVVKKDKIEVVYIQSEGPSVASAGMGRKLRESFGIQDADFVFGRIGRSDNDIFDPIGIKAFKKIQGEYPHAHYIIMSPAAILVEMVAKENIKNVHFVKPSSREEDIWAFHQSLDCLAHFRKDGESCGLNIAEAMLCGKPVISHRSRQWNAQSEYLDADFSRIAEIDNADQYAAYMREMIEAKKSGIIREMGAKAKEKAEKLFLIKNNIAKIEALIENAIQ